MSYIGGRGNETSNDVAIVGMAGRFPGARNLVEYWRNLCGGIESITFLSDRDLAESGVEAAAIKDPAYVRALGVLEDIELFDAGFFEMNPREAEITDPQQRVFLECAWEALEDAGYDPERYAGSIGVYAGTGASAYWIRLLTDPQLLAAVGGLQVFIGNDKDFLATLVSYKLNLTGPSVTVQTACSTSLVAVHLACQSLLNGECDMVLAGGSRVKISQKEGYFYQEGGIASPDGHCRAFDANAQGTVGGSGVGVVVLKRLEDALADRDTIHAVIKGSAINNDGSRKVGYTAPSIKGQANVIREALAVARVRPEDISYIEAHGTGTPLGDPIEIKALTHAFGKVTGNKHHCGLGSVKGNIGHLDAAAGVASLIKTVLALRHGKVPASLNCERPNPLLELEVSPFYINTGLRNWERNGSPRRAGVSSFGIGGTNAHVVLEEGPEWEEEGSGRRVEVLTLSGRSEGAVREGAGRMREYLERPGDGVNLADVGYTLQVGRRGFSKRRALVVGGVVEAIERLREVERGIVESVEVRDERGVGLMFSGQGTQRVWMGRELYEVDRRFQERVQEGSRIVEEMIGVDLKRVLYPDEGSERQAEKLMEETRIGQPALFVVEYAVSEWLSRCGIDPVGMIGHSLGEYVAACVAGVFSFRDGVRLVVERGRLMQSMPEGRMVAVEGEEVEVRKWVGEEGIWLSGVNGGGQCVVSGREKDIERVERRLEGMGVRWRRLRTRFGFHSGLMEGMLREYGEVLGRMELREPNGRYVSNVSGEWIGGEAREVGYWLRQIREPVRFGDGLKRLVESGVGVLMEVGPGSVLSGLARRQAREVLVVETLGDGGVRGEGEERRMNEALGRLWERGVEARWEGLYAGERRRRVSLPTYPFQRERYWIERDQVKRRDEEEKSEIRESVKLPQHSRPRLSSRYQEPADEIERTVIDIWGGLLGIDSIGVNDDFFELGGNSLLATQVASRARSKLGVEVSIRTLFEQPTAGAMAALIRQQWNQLAAQSGKAIGRVKREGALPLSYAQQRLWFIHQLEPESAAYNIAIGLRLRGLLDVAALWQSMEVIVSRHEALRTRFEDQDGVAVQVIEEVGAIDLLLCDLSGFAGAEREGELRLLESREAGLKFDLARGPVLRVSLVRLDVREHVLLTTVHHIVSDGWSMGVMIKEFAAQYETYRAGSVVSLPELPIQYVDYAIWQREWLKGEVLQGELGYWEERLRGVSVLDLPTDRPRAAVANPRSEILSFALPAELARGLREMSQRDGTTLFMGLLAGFTLLLARYSGQEDIAVGTPVAGRTRAETEGLVGFFVNTLVLRTDVGGNPTVRELLSRVRETALGAYAHQEVPFEKLVEHLQPDRSLSREPLFQTMLSLQNGGERIEGIRQVEVGHERIEVGSAKFELMLTLKEVEDGIHGAIEYRSDVYDLERIMRFAGHLKNVLAGMIEGSERAIGQVSLLSERERHQMTVEWSAGDREGVRYSCLHEMFEEQVERSRDRIGVTGEEGVHVSYGELNAKANQLAHYLRRRGVGAEDRVGICLRRGSEMVEAMMGVLKAGSAYVALDLSYPLPRLRYMVRDAGMRMVVADKGSEPLGEPFGVERVYLDLQRELIGLESRSNEATVAGPANLAYIIYTSGSTGEPKGVGITHRSARGLVSWAIGRYGEGAHAVAATTSICFDLSVFEIFVPLSYGGRVVIGESALGIEKLVAAERATAINTVPSAMETALNGGGLESAVEIVNLAGEALSGDLVRKLYGTGLVGDVFNLYGPSETTTYSTYCEVRRWEDAKPGIGRPIANTQTYVTDRNYEAVPIAVQGELYIAGMGLARGYTRDLAKTAEKFVPNPHGECGGRMYRTGDQVRWRSSGELDYIGRGDDQVKLRGYRIEPGEIEAVLREHEMVRQSAVIVRECEGGQKRLVGYVVLKDGETGGQANELRLHLRARLPDYMVPWAIVEIDEMPLTANGKLDRRRLPAVAGPGVRGEEEAERNPVEEIVAGIWSEVLGVGDVGREANFFELGGHSLLAAQVVSRVREALGVELGLRVLFERPTVSGLAEVVESGVGRTAKRGVIGLVERGRGLPLSYAQRRLWFIQKLEPGSAAYSIPLAVRVLGELDEAALGQTLEEIGRRHEVLRTRYEERDGEVVQVIEGGRELEMGVLDLRRLGAEEVTRVALEIVEAEAMRPFDLGRGPVWRGGMVKLEEGDQVLILNLHHVAGDAWSTGVMIKEFAANYSAFRRGSPSSLRELALQYADYAVWQRQWLEGTVIEEQIDYWKRQLSELQVIELPADRPRPAVASHRGALETFTISSKVAEPLRRLSRREGVTLFMSLLAAFQVVLSRHAALDDVVVGTDVANRNQIETEGLIGFFVNQLVLRTDMSGNPSVSETLKRVRETNLGAYANQDVPFERLVEELAPARDLGRSPLFQVKLLLQNQPQNGIALDTVELRPFGVASRFAKFDLTVALTERPDSLGGVVEYASDLYESLTMVRLIGHIQIVLASMVAGTEQRIGDICLLTPEERSQLLEWNDTARDYGRVLWVHELFEDQAECIPDSVAVVSPEGQLSYAALNNRANQLARYLGELGLGAEARVALCFERGLEMLIGVLAALKAGAAYVPMDPNYPAERLAYMLEDAGAQILLTSSHVLDRLPTTWVYSIEMDSLWPLIERSPSTNLAVKISHASLAYLIYTSGSTGRPKGVALTHSGLTNLARAQTAPLAISKGTMVLHIASPSYDASVWEYSTALIAGARLVVGKPGAMLAGEDLGHLIQRERVEVATIPPSVLASLSRLERDALTTLVVAGEKCSEGLTREWAGGRRMLNAYGPTEITVCATRSKLSPNQRPMIGRPIANLRTFVTDSSLQLAPPGLQGELWVGGIGVARGYWNQPSLTAERFVPDGFSGEAGHRLYRTGDKAKWSPDGELEYLGRLDRQVKLRGNRIEIGEIESILAEHPAVKQAVVFTDDASVGMRLVAYVVAVEDVSPRTTLGHDLRAYLRQKLPEYMVPAACAVVDQLPLTSSGKLDRRRLPALDVSPAAPGGSAAGPAAEYLPPTTDMEQTVWAIWRDVLRLERISIQDNFFDIGGHSLLMVQILSKLQEVVDCPLSMMELFQYPTIHSLSAFLMGRATTAPETATPPEAQLVAKLKAAKKRQSKRRSKSETLRARDPQDEPVTQRRPE